MKKSRKHIRSADVAPISKTVPASCEHCPRSSDIKPSWRLSSLRRGNIDRFRFPEDPGELLAILKNMKEFETQTLASWRSDRNGNHYATYSLTNCADKLDKEIVDFMIAHDIEEIHRFRLDGKKRVYALSFNRGVFELIWWDPDHKIYPIEEK